MHRRTSAADWKTVWPMRLGRLYISKFYLPVEDLAACQPNMKQNQPVAAHAEFECTLIPAWSDFSGFAKDRAHPRMRHVAFQRNMRPHQPFTGCAGQSDCESVDTYPRRPWIKLIGENDLVRGL